MTTASRNRRQRSISATNSEWIAIKNHAREAGMDVSAYIIKYARPVKYQPDLDAALGRTERKVTALYEVMRVQLESNGMEEAWKKCVAKADEDFDRERGKKRDKKND